MYSELLRLRTGGEFKVCVYSKLLRIGTRINVFMCSWVRNVHNIVGFSRRNRCSRLENGGDYDDDGMKNVGLRSADLDLYRSERKNILFSECFSKHYCRCFPYRDLCVKFGDLVSFG